MRTGRVRLLAPAIAVALLLTGCTEQGQTGSDQTGIDDVVQQWKSPDTAPVTFSGSTVDGARFDSKQYLGKVLVVNFWFAGCSPCRAEAPLLKTLATQFKSDGVQFVGVDTIDDRSTAAAFARRSSPVYPSIVDQEDGSAVQLAFASARGPKVTPTTLVLDRKGRVTARYVGLVNQSNLQTLIQDAVDGTAA